MRVLRAILAATVVGSLVLAGCTVPVDEPAPTTESVRTTTQSSAAGPAVHPTVTVPGLGGTTPSSPTENVPAGTSTDSVPAGTPVPTGTLTTETLTTGSSPDVVPAGTSQSSGSVPAGTPTVTETPATPDPLPGTPAGIDLSDRSCPDCVVLGSHADVAGGLAVALVRTGGRAAVMAVRADGSTSSVLAVSYGTTFPPPAGGLLPCDSGGRCIVQGMTPEGDGVVSLFALGSDGVLTDLTPEGGLKSSATASRVVVKDGEPVPVVVELVGSQPVWVAYGWQGDGYGVLGCAADPDPAALTLDACGS